MLTHPIVGDGYVPEIHHNGVDRCTSWCNLLHKSNQLYHYAPTRRCGKIVLLRQAVLSPKIQLFSCEKRLGVDIHID